MISEKQRTIATLTVTDLPCYSMHVVSFLLVRGSRLLFLPALRECNCAFKNVQIKKKIVENSDGFLLIHGKCLTNVILGINVKF